MQIAFFASHAGTNMQAIIDACMRGEIEAEPCVVISNNADAQAFVRARQENIPSYHLSGKTISDVTLLDSEILNILQKHPN